MQRHGKAGDGHPDEIRELTPRGRRDVEQVILDSLEKIPELSEIQASPLFRAHQTADIVANVFSFAEKILINECLTPWSSPTDFLNSLDDSQTAIFVASHQPFVGELVTFLTGEHVAVPTSALFAIEIDYPAEGGGKLLWQSVP